MDEKKRRFLRQAQFIKQSTLTAYPNPERVGCPGEAALREAAARTDYDALFAEPVWKHITHCSPCYSEYLAIVDRLKSDL